MASPPVRRGPPNGASAPPEERAVPVELGPVRPEAATAANGADEEDEADAQTVRRQIAAASRSFDPDHQIRRAMDAFLSPTPVERDASGREH